MRLVTRGDMDGLACAVIITTFEKIDDIVLIHPQQITDGIAKITNRDILANLPYHPGCAKWFDHHQLTPSNPQPPEVFDGAHALAASAAELVWKYYGQDPRFERLVAETSRFDAAQLTREDVLNPQGYILLGFTVDSRSSLGQFRSYFLSCCEWLKTLPIEAVLEKGEVRMRALLLRQQEEDFRRVLTAASRREDNVAFTDLRAYYPPPIGNRFLIFVLYPKCNVAVRIHWGPERGSVIVTAGHSIFNRTCKTNIGLLMAEYGGGGHSAAGSAPLPLQEADDKIAEILGALRETR